MIDQTTLEGNVITAAFDLAIRTGWNEISLRDIADAAERPLSEVMTRFSDKDDVMKRFTEEVDRTMLAAAGDIEREQSARDAVFEAIMMRFDAMAPYRAALRAIAKDRTKTFPSLPQSACVSLATQNKILQAAGISASGTPALVRRIGLAQIYSQVFRVWLDDEDTGMAKTMAALDRRLRQGERSLRTIDDVARSSMRMCGRASTMASRVLSAMCRAGRQGRNDTPSTEPPNTHPA